MNIDQAKEISIADILDRLGISPKKTTADKQLYLSPVRLEKTPSFYVYLKDNRWHDYGDGRGGDAIDFAQAFLKFTREADNVADALRWLKNMGMGPYVFKPVTDSSPPPSEPGLILKKAGPIQHIGLIHYLAKRGIPLPLAQQYLKEIHVRNGRTGKRFFALGIDNEEGGYELRNPFFKGTLGHKAITFIRGSQSKNDAINIYEGFMDYLSTLAQLQSNTHRGDTIVLNSLSCLKQITPYVQDYGYRTAYTWLDNDPAGQQATAALGAFFQTQSELTHVRMNTIYEPCKDVNEWHMHKLGLSL